MLSNELSTNTVDVRFVQTVLNKTLSIRLAVDGVIGPATRAAIIEFQRRQGLTPDGIIGPATLAALQRASAGGGGYAGGSAATCKGLASPELLDGFAFDRDRLDPRRHAPVIDRIVNCILAAEKSGQPVRTVRLVGHTDPVGSATYNLDLGRRRAQSARDGLAAALRARSPLIAGQMKFVVETRGEHDPVSGDAAKNRRVAIYIPSSTKPPRKGCPPYKARVRLHYKIFMEPTVPIATMEATMRSIYGAAGFQVEVASRERLTSATLLDIDLRCPDDPHDCCFTPVSSSLAELHALYRHRNHVGPQDIAVYFVRSTLGALNGCAAHPPGLPGVIITSIASRFTLAHEVGHVLGLNHVTGEPCGTPGFVPTRLMTACSTSNLAGVATLSAAEVKTMDASSLTVNC